jgi:nucleoside transporter
VLALTHFAGGVLLLFLPSAVHAGNTGLVLTLIFAYKLFYQPSMGLANSIAFRHLAERKNVFPIVRLFGTLGWVVAGLTIGALGLSASTAAFIVTAIGSFVMGAYSLTLPRTTPGAKGQRFSLGDLVGARAFVLLRNRSFLVFMICIILTSISLGTYNSYASTYLGALGVQNVAGVLSLGQLSELVFIATIPFVLRLIGMKAALLTGMAMWGVRFLVFGLAAQHGSWLAIAAIGLHGICNDFVLVIGAMYIDRVAPIALQAQAQSMLILMIQGVGAAIGSFVAGTVYNATVGQIGSPTPGDWAPMWMFPIAAAIVTVVLWITLFQNPTGEDARISLPQARGVVKV